MPDQFTIQTSQNVTLQVEYASLGDRIVATLIDESIRIAYILLAYLLVTPSLQTTGPFPLILILLALPFVLYHLFFEMFNNGQTPGKKAMRLQVATLDGTPVSIRAYVLRWLFRLIDVQLLYGLVAIIAIASGKNHQRVGDMVAGTTVVKKVTRHNIRSTIFEEVEEDYTPTFIQAKRLAPGEVELIKEVLHNHSSPRSKELTQTLARKLEGYLEIPPQPSPREFLNTLLKDYSHLNR